MQFELTKEFVNQIKECIEAQDDAYLKTIFDELYSEDIAPILYELDSESQRYIINLLDTETIARVFSNMDEETRHTIFKTFTPKEIARFINELYSDDAADILNTLPVKSREEIISNIEDKEMGLHISELLRYDDDCAGGLMAKELIKTNLNWTVKQTIDEIRNQSENVEKLYTIYVVDDDDVLQGRVSLKKIILSKDKTVISEIYEPDIVSVETFADASEVSEIMQKYDLETIPVVNMQGKLVGRITIDDAMDVIKEQSVEDMQAMSGISSNVEEDDSVWKLSKARLPWLIVGIIGGIVGASFMGLFEHHLVMVPAMAFFIPLITATGGNVGVQSSSIIVQSLANSEGLEINNFQRLYRVSLVALINAIVICSLVFFFVWITGHPIKLSIVVSVSLFFVVFLASIMGTITPLILDRFGINPALASGPFITTANDLLGLAVYFTTAGLLLHI
ncbi:MAG: magnesium transporter [Bacteroidota bacterium]|nr:magnesium transporter [Bacteroidota bacterium]